MSFVDLPVKRGFDSNPLSHFSRTHYSMIPLFQHSNCERSELSSASEFLQLIECTGFFESWIFASCRNDGMMEYWNVGF